MQNDEFKSAFIAAIRSGGSERERAFRFFEDKLAPSFKGPDGYTFFTDLLSIVKEADPDAVKEYQDRFVPLLDQELLQKQVMEAFKEALPTFVASKQKAFLAQGGQPAVNIFLKYAVEYAAKDDNSLREWIDLALPSLPEHDRHTVVHFLVETAFPK